MAKRSQSAKGNSAVKQIDYEGIVNDIKKSESGIFRSFKEGKNYVRPVPFMSATDDRFKVFRKTRVHFGLCPKHKSIPCLDDCPICKAANKPEFKQYKKALAPKTQILMCMVNREDGSVEVMRIPNGVWGDISEVIKNPEDYPNCLSFEDGYDFLIQKSGSGLATEYTCSVLPKKKPAGVEAAKVPDLDAMDLHNPMYTEAFIKELLDEILGAVNLARIAK